MFLTEQYSVMNNTLLLSLFLLPLPALSRPLFSRAPAPLSPSTCQDAMKKEAVPTNVTYDLLSGSKEIRLKARYRPALRPFQCSHRCIYALLFIASERSISLPSIKILHKFAHPLIVKLSEDPRSPFKYRICSTSNIHKEPFRRSLFPPRRFLSSCSETFYL